MISIEKFITNKIIPTALLRQVIRHLIRRRLIDETRSGIEVQQERLMLLIEELKKSPIAVLTEKANEQHYEVPADFYLLTLGKHLKYSGCYWEDGVQNLTQAEECMLQLTCKRAELEDSMQILELGCGWGSLSLFMAARYPNSRITAVSNSASQKVFIEKKAQQRGLDNLKIVTADINNFATEQKFDRVVSVEMFEHMRNYQMLLRNIASWLKSNGKLFVHIFTNCNVAYLFEDRGPADWMGRHFFSGGIMPSDHLLAYFQDDLKLSRHWRVNGVHYQKTARAWHDNLMRNKNKVLSLFEQTYGIGSGSVWFARWKLFFLACDELFGYQKGEQWLVSHYLFERSHNE